MEKVYLCSTFVLLLISGTKIRHFSTLWVFFVSFRHFFGIFLRFSNHLVKSDCLFMQETNCGHAEVNRQDRRKHIVIGFGK